jgi:phenylacetate-CoA ligase
MISVRGVNVYPAAIESVVRGFPEIIEFRSTVSKGGAMRSLSIEIEVTAEIAEVSPIASRLSGKLREVLGLTVPVHAVGSGTLPRFEMKARRFVVEE